MSELALNSKGQLIHISQQRSFSKESDYAAFAAVRVHNSLLKKLGGRNAWVFIESPHGSAYRTIRGNGSITPFPEDAIELDYDTSIELEIHKTEPVNPADPPEEQFFSCDLNIRPAGKLEVIKAHWYHPNPAYRIPLQISLLLGGLSVLLGITGMIIGLLGLLSG